MKNNTTDNLTKDQAIKAMREGKKVRHKYFASDEWVTLTKSGNYKFEDGCEAGHDLFWLDRQSKEWETGWLILELNEREQTEGKTKEEIIKEATGYAEDWTAFAHAVIVTDVKNVKKAMQLYSDQQTAPFLKTIASLEEAVKEKDKLIEGLTKKAKKWDNLGQMIAKCYCSYDENGNEYPPEKQGANLTDIGEMAALAFGYL